MHDSYTQADLEQSTLQLIIDQVEELIVTVIEEIRDRPAVVVAILAAVVGAVVGSMLASGGRRRTAPPTRVARSARGVADAAELAGIGLKLLQNPLVRSYIRSALEGQFKKRFSGS